MTILFSNNASTTVSGSITAASTSVALAAGTGVLFPNPTGGNFYVATFYDQATKTVNEIIHVTAMSGDIATIVRAQEGTTAKAWNAGDIFANLVTAGTLNNFVQAGTGPANTSIVYVGTDTSVTPNLIVATTNPVPASLATGMQFNIWVKNNSTGSGPVNVQLNGGSSILATRQNGASLVAGDITGNEEMIFIYNGVNLTAMVPNTLPPSLSQPPVTTFYVRTDGNDNNTGFANTPTQAFATCYGAVNAINTRYISQFAITIRVADGTYIGGVGIQGGFIAAWNIIGNTSNPGNVVIDATSTSPPAGAYKGVAIVSNAGSSIQVYGMTFKSYYENVGSFGDFNIYGCNFTGTISGDIVIYAGSGNLRCFGTCTYNSSGITCQSLFGAAYSAYLELGYHDIYQSFPLTFNLLGSPVFSIGTAFATTGSTITLDPAMVTFSGATPTGSKYYANAAGGVMGAVYFPGTAPGQVYSPGYIG
jgi:hypothetical protein